MIMGATHNCRPGHSAHTQGAEALFPQAAKMLEQEPAV